MSIDWKRVEGIEALEKAVTPGPSFWEHVCYCITRWDAREYARRQRAITSYRFRVRRVDAD